VRLAKLAHVEKVQMARRIQLVREHLCQMCLADPGRPARQKHRDGLVDRLRRKSPAQLYGNRFDRGVCRLPVISTAVRKYIGV